MNGKSTIKIMQALSGGEYSDPFEVRSLINKDTMRPDAFAERLWRILHIASRCPVVERFCREGASGVEAALTGEWLERWNAMYAKKEKSPEELDVVDFLRGVCVGKPLCRPCRCKDRVISFFTDIMGGDSKARNAAKRNVSNWLTDKLPIDRDTYIKLCYALGLRTLGEEGEVEKAKSANRFLSLHCTQNPLHLSDAEESIHYFCLRRPMGTELPAEGDYSGVDNYNFALSLIERIGTATLLTDDSWMFTVEAGCTIDHLCTEEEILSYAQSCRTHLSDEYYTAKSVMRDFLSAYEEQLDISGINSVRMRAGINKEDARRVIHIFEQLDTDSSALAETAGYTERLGDVLYASGIAGEIADGRRPMSRTVLLLCLLAQNCGAVFSPEQMDMVQTDDFTDLPSFNEFFRLLNSTLEDCSMAPMNPRRRLDFLVLYSYLLFSRDAMMSGMPDAFSAYMARAIERITG